MGEDAQLATVLADALLAGAWARHDMIERLVHVLGSRRRWARVLVGETLAAYPHPPSDTPRQLATWLLAGRTFEELRHRAERPRGRLPDSPPARLGPIHRALPTAVHRLTEPTAMVRHRFPVTRIDDAGALADLLDLTVPELLWFADTKGLLRRSQPHRLHHYTSHWVPTASGGVRLLEAPMVRLRRIQRRILEELLAPVPVHPDAHGFVGGRSVKTAAQQHVDAKTVMSLDLQSFFAVITAARVYGVFRSIGYPEPVAHLLTGLCTHATPVRVLSMMPGTGADSAAFRLRRRLAAAHLPQGAPTSPQLANLCCFRLDRRLAGYAEAMGAAYTRYADDLTFSGTGLAVGRRGMVAAVARIVGEEGFSLNTAKTRIRGRDARQEVAGVVVNTSPRVAREEFDLLRAILHNCVVRGPGNQNRLGHSDFRAHLRGRIAWVGHLDSEQGRRLLATFDQIDWSTMPG